eukprot:TRINITY_DN686_c0_g1_i1.p1 TRINITY_DN686_c0_g1~~TRINITY_DN686_c0_g1_i1.p1  ORF type:complete len:311 (+),score=38.16 TRINITY_DN686_c0_g1_i1:41-934(+)
MACQPANSTFVNCGTVGRCCASGAGVRGGGGIGGGDTWQHQGLAIVIARQNRVTLPFLKGATLSLHTRGEARCASSPASPRLLIRCNATQQSNDSTARTRGSDQAAPARTSSTTKTTTDDTASTSASALSGKGAGGQSLTSGLSANAAPSVGRTVSRGKPAAGKKEEGFNELMGFSGSIPERVNGRLAMIGFLLCAVNEKLSGLNFVEQAQRSPGSVLSWIIFISFASVLPKYVSEVSLSELMEAAKKDGMPAQLKMANADVEQAVGRTAMLGFLGTLLVELIFQGGVFDGSLKLPF